MLFKKIPRASSLKFSLRKFKPEYLFPRIRELYERASDATVYNILLRHCAFASRRDRSALGTADRGKSILKRERTFLDGFES